MFKCCSLITLSKCKLKNAIDVSQMFSVQNTFFQFLILCHYKPATFKFIMNFVLRKALFIYQMCLAVHSEPLPTCICIGEGSVDQFGRCWSLNVFSVAEPGKNITMEVPIMLLQKSSAGYTKGEWNSAAFLALCCYCQIEILL